jgi:hypothetical protein
MPNIFRNPDQIRYSAQLAWREGKSRRALRLNALADRIEAVDRYPSHAAPHASRIAALGAAGAMLLAASHGTSAATITSATLAGESPSFTMAMIGLAALAIAASRRKRSALKQELDQGGEDIVTIPHSRLSEAKRNLTVSRNQGPRNVTLAIVACTLASLGIGAVGLLYESGTAHANEYRIAVECPRHIGAVIACGTSYSRCASVASATLHALPPAARDVCEVNLHR